MKRYKKGEKEKKVEEGLGLRRGREKKEARELLEKGRKRKSRVEQVGW